MTATMPKTNLKPLNVRKVMLASAITLLAVLLIVGGVLLLSRHSTDEPVVDLEQVQNDLVQELTDRHGEYDERSIVLTGTNKVTAKKLAEKLGADLRITSDGSFATLTLPEGMTFLDVAQAEKYLNDLPKMSVDYEARISEIVEENEGVNSERLPMRPQYTVTDGSYELQTYLDYLNMRNLWSYTRGNDITVAIIDTGIDTDHPEFAGRISEYSYNASEDKIVKDYKTKNGSYDWSLIEDEQGHGTSVAGVIGASMDSGEIVGIAPQVTLLVIKAECDEYGNFKRTSDLVFGLYYAIERDVNVVNMSFGGYGLNPYAEAAQLAVDSDIICVAAAGNDATADLCYPAADENVFGIGALAADSWELADYSNYGENVDFVAPGTTFTTKMGGGYATTNGTSLACPTAVGVIALYLSENKYQEVDFVEELLRASCYDLGDLGPDWYYGYGAIDAYALIKEERGTVTFNMMTDELDNTTQTFIRNHTLQDMPEPERLYAVFDGWYRDPQCTNEYRWYEDKFSTDLTLYANWVNEDDGVPYIYVELDDGTIEIRAYTGHRRYITIPDYIDGKVVSSIGEGAFAGETNLREVNLPKYLVRIRDRAFMGCSNLVSMSILDTVAEIGAHAFYDNIRLSSVAFGENSQLTTIGNFAFKGCGKLRNFTVPKNVTILNGSAFYGDTSMQSFAVQEGSETFFALDGVLLNHTMTTAVAYPAGRSGEYTLPTSIKTVGDYAFAFAKISQVDLANVQTIGNAAFIYSRLETLNIPDSVTQMGEKAFASCQYLKVLTLGHGLTEISNSAFYKCSMLQSVEIPNTIQIIGDGAFAFASLQQGLTFEENSSLIVIGSEAFRCTDILSVRIPASVVSIGDVAFAGSCSSNLASVVFEKGSNLQRIGGSAFQKTMIAEIILPNRLEQIGEFAFSYTKLKTVTLPASLTLLGEGAFASCHSLENIFVEDANAVYTDVDGVVYDTSKTTLVEYPAGNTRTQYTVLDGVVTIGKAAFYGTTNIQTVNLPDSVKVLDEYSFYDCSAQQYQLSSNLQEIKMYALSKNKHLTSIAIPDSVMQISNYAFAEDWRLRSVTFTEKSKLPRISFGAFAYCGLQSFRVPANVSTMAQGAFLGCPDLKSFTFAKNSKLESISAYMFDGCSNLQSITFEQGSALTSIQAHGMEGMTKLRNIDLGDAKLTNIDNFAFRFCESLTHVDIPEGVTNLGRYAFYYCTSLSEIQIPSTMEHIGRFAFLGTEEMNVYFASETLPQYLDEDWDHDIAGYYLGVTDVITDGDWKYAKLTSGGIAIIEYLGEATEIDLTALDLGGDIVSIGGKAFYFSMVESIKLPETLVTIQANAFYHSALKSITIPESVQFIGREAFAYTPITSLTFADNSKLTVMEQSAFENTEELGSVVLPKSLTTIGRAIFKNSGITSLTFEKGIAITEISEEAFAYTNIKTLIIPDDITLINHNAFRNTAQLEGVSFGSADFMVMSNAFYQSGLKSLHIPANMTYVGEYAFVALPNLTEFTVDENNSYYTAVDGLLVGQSGRKLIAVPAGREGSLIVPEGIEVIGFGAFEDSKLSEIQFLDNANILSFGYRAFYNAKNITEMHIPASVVAIDYYAFANCTALETVTFADGSGLNGVYEGAFYGCKNLSEIQLPDGIDEISDFAFYGCRKLTKLPVSETSGIKGIYSYAMAYSGLGGEFTTPATLYDIGDYAFLGTRVTEVIITDTNVKDLIIGIGAFEECNVLEEITLPFIGASFENPDITWFGYIFGAGAWEANSVYLPESLKKVTITEGITFVGEGAFYKISSIEEIELPHSITKLCHWAFFGCKSKHELTNEISIDDKVLRWGTFGEGISGHLTLAEGITEISDSVFYRCYGLVSITLPNGITRIDGFYESGLREIVITEGVTHIASNAFAHCASLISVTLPSTLVSIDTGAFDYCKSLYTIINNSNLNITFGTTDNGCIGQYAELIIDKYGNKHYKKVDTEYIDTTDGFRFVYQNGEYQLIAYLGKEATVRLPKDINGNNYSIKNPSGLRHVIIPGELIEINDQAFQRCQSLLSVTIEEGVKSIGEKAFSNCASLTTVILPDSVTDIGEWMFSDCSSLKCVLLSGSLKTIPVNAFIRCYSLENISIPPSVTKIDSQAFKECNSLVEVNLPEKLTTIGVGAFENCGLTKIKIPNSVKQINLGAFKGCDNLVLMFNDDNPNFQVKDGIVYNKDMTSFVYIPLWITSVEIPKTITDVSYTFANHPNLQTVTFEQGGKLTKIGSQAFEGCEKLVQITLPDNITTIGYAAFSRCISLKKIKIPTSVTMIEPSAFNSCEKLAKIDIPTNITTIYSSTFSYCRSLTDIILPENLKHIQLNAFWHSGVTNLSIPAGVQTIEERAFEGCDNLYFITNNSNLPLTPGSNDHGAIAAAAVCITDKNGNRIWRKDDATYIETEDQFLFKCKGGAYQLLAYLGNKETVTLPLDINGNPYSIYHMTGVKNVIIPYGITSIDEAAFYRCATLNSIEIPESVLSIGSNAFCQCTNLTEIVIPQSVRSIGNAAFSGSGLLSISLPQNITRIENSAFSDTDFYNDPDNWENGILYIDDYLICVSQNVEYFELKEGTKLVAGGAYYRCYKLKIAYVFGDIDFAYYDLTNLETLVVFELPRRISSYFEEVPLTLKNIILKKGITMNSSAFNAITNVCIWSEDNERDTLWDENYPNWNNGNRVVYGNSWIWANFYDDTREMKSKKIYTTTQIVRVPWLDDYQMGDYMYTFQGFDIDGDGAMDNVPATSQINVVGYAVYSKESICNWYGHEYNKWTETKRPTCTEVGEERHDCERCEHFETREVKALGHATVQHDAKDAACTGIGWYAYKTCSRCDYTTYVEIPAKGHSHNAVVMNPTCTERGYTIHACHCGDAYVDSYVDALDHKFGEWVETKAPTCTEVGEDRKDCEACDHFETREIPIVDHADDDANGTCDMCGKRMASEEEPSGGCLSVLTISSYSVLVMAAFSFLAVFKKKKD